MTREELEQIFAHHPPPSLEKRAQHVDVRQTCRRTAEFLEMAVPDGHEKDVMRDRLREVMMWANAAIALSP